MQGAVQHTGIQCSMALQVCSAGLPSGSSMPSALQQTLSCAPGGSAGAQAERRKSGLTKVEREHAGWELE